MDQSSSLPSRRDFVKLSTAAAGLVGSLSVARSAHAASSDIIKIGLIGCGGRGSGAAKNALDADPNVKLVAIGDAFQDQVDKSVNALSKLGDRVAVPKDKQFVGFDAYKQVIASDVDLVILATPPGFRPIHFAAAVEAGKHVFMEKPVAVDAPGVRAVIETAKKAKQKNLGVGVGLQRRHQASYIDAVKRIQDGAIGDVIAQRVYWNSAGVWEPRKNREDCKSDMEYQMRNWYYYNWLCGDHIVEQHIHNLDVGCWVKDAWPVAAEGMGGRQVRVDPKYGEIYDHHAVEFEFGDGTRMFSFCRHIPRNWNSVSEHMHGAKGTANLNGSGSGSATIATKEGEWKFSGESIDPYKVEHAALFSSIRSGTPNNEGERGAKSTMVAILGRYCTYSGRMITWDEAINSNVSLAPTEYSWDVMPPAPSVAMPGFTDILGTGLAQSSQNEKKSRSQRKK